MAKGSPAVLTIAGSDSSGGAGIQADLKTFAAFGCYGASVITALTAQNTIGVQAVHGVPPEFVSQQINSVLSDIDVRGMKTGMLFDSAVIHAVSSTLKEHFTNKGVIPLVCDPVSVSTSGHSLLHPDAVDAMVDEIFPLSCLITPNKSEAELLLRKRGFPSLINTVQDMIIAAQNLSTLGSKAVLLKGGHINITRDDLNGVVSLAVADIEVNHDFIFDKNVEILQAHNAANLTNELVVDVLYIHSERKAILYPRPRLVSSNTHGTGCTLSAALACALGRDIALAEATAQATSYTHLGIETASPIGQGFGPLNHLHSVTKSLIAPRTVGNPFPLTYSLIRDTSATWTKYVQHEFVVQLGKGTLDRSSFIHFIKQDYHYLKYYARAHALLAAKSDNFTPILAATHIVLHIAKESSMHTSYCAQWGITKEELESTPESTTTTAYGAFLLDTGLQGDTMKLVMVLAACLLGYGEVGLWLKSEAQKPNSWVVWEGNPYLKWMEDYSGEDYQNAVKVGLETIESRALQDPPSAARYAEWLAVWERCTSLEKSFWDVAMNLS
ncbi:Phosphomethylpyrimidine kinase-domain-containing protein [Pisolithus orientalis]|uniref:Phosphomethylpyrimidine kinase-domain-containing protein n=1 Tax=Pisolithus orientalis TaxID=936130 RepID=UPI002224124D|nr:Phosphomethylpyrimidine kinase-domain-containing protein [Pisolithus orientalis]KAI6009574.1 Phosphomethylpyrimidine kinase-domain-containing protein [Pisolithus orientalis]